MIPKIIHYCWFGPNPISEKERTCIESWKRMCPDYEIIEWNENNYDIKKCRYMYEAYQEKKWGFVPDYARMDIIYNYGGIYLDTDVEIIKSLDSLLNNNAFMGFEDGKYVAPGLIIGAEKKNELIKQLRDIYDNILFYEENGVLNLKPSPVYVTEYLKKIGIIQNNRMQIIEGIRIYPTEFFCPRDYLSGEMRITSNTFTIHWFNASWKTEEERQQLELIHKMSKLFGKFIGKNVAEYTIETKKNGLKGINKLTKEKLKRKIHNEK